MGQRVQFAEHPWQRTHTLQFDKKRFVIVGEWPLMFDLWSLLIFEVSSDLAVDADGDRKQSTFFVDHHSKWV